MTAERQRAVGGETSEWYTPPEIFQALAVRFDVDPAAPVGGLPWIPADTFYSHHDDGLAQRWAGRVWLNPPYGPHTARWLGKLAGHGDGIALVFARTDVRWFQTVAAQADLVCFIAGRIRFVPPGVRSGNGHNAAAPSCLLAFGEDNAASLWRSQLGLCGSLRADRSVVGASAGSSSLDTGAV